MAVYHNWIRKHKTKYINEFTFRINSGNYTIDTIDRIYAKDIILAIISKIGVAGGAGYVLEYAGDVIRDLDMAGRMTICNMSIEAGARAGMIGVDEKNHRLCSRTSAFSTR